MDGSGVGLSCRLNICVLIHILAEGGVGALLNQIRSSSKILLLTVQRQCFFCGSFMLFLSCVCYAFACVCLLMPCGRLLGKLSFVMSNFVFVTFSCGILGQVWYFIVSNPDLCHLSYFVPKFPT